MKFYDNYGVVYTPQKLASFVAELLVTEYLADHTEIERIIHVLDPACGEGILLKEAKDKFEREINSSIHYYGVDIDSKTIHANGENYGSDKYSFIAQDFIIPSSEIPANDYWKDQIKHISCIIANPPWSATKIFRRDDLRDAGYHLDTGQYDSYALFIELCLKIVDDDGMLAFIIPDSLFSGDNKTLRKYLLDNTEVKVLARLGEKIFPHINRSTSVIIIKKCVPTKETKTKCYRLDSDARYMFLNGELDLYQNYSEHYHIVRQDRFLKNQNYMFDIDTRENEEFLLNKIERKSIDWNSLFRFGRGVEISKQGVVVTCDCCKMNQGYSKKQFMSGEKRCKFCGQIVPVNFTNVYSIVSDEKRDGYIPIYVGENVHRYNLCGLRYIKPNVVGVNYKNKKQYDPPKILIRKTGLGINACIDYCGTYISQTVYSINYLDNNDSKIPLEYYLGILNSRLLYYYYLKKYGENEWKSHPYLTKDIIFSLPLRSVSEDNIELAMKIATCTRSLLKHYTKELDLQVERLVMQLYEISCDEMNIILQEINALPNLSAINGMKLQEGELDV